MGGKGQRGRRKGDTGVKRKRFGAIEAKKMKKRQREVKKGKKV